MVFNQDGNSSAAKTKHDLIYFAFFDEACLLNGELPKYVHVIYTSNGIKLVGPYVGRMSGEGSNPHEQRVKLGYSARDPSSRKDCNLDGPKGTQVRLEVVTFCSKSAHLQTVIVAVIENYFRAKYYNICKRQLDGPGPRHYSREESSRGGKYIFITISVCVCVCTCVRMSVCIVGI